MDPFHPNVQNASPISFVHPVESLHWASPMSAAVCGKCLVFTGLYDSISRPVQGLPRPMIATKYIRPSQGNQSMGPHLTEANDPSACFCMCLPHIGPGAVYGDGSIPGAPPVVRLLFSRPFPPVARLCVGIWVPPTAT